MRTRHTRKILPVLGSTSSLLLQQSDANIVDVFLILTFTDAVVQQHPGAKIPDIWTAINKRICELSNQEEKKTKDN